MKPTGTISPPSKASTRRIAFMKSFFCSPRLHFCRPSMASPEPPPIYHSYKVDPDSDADGASRRMEDADGASRRMETAAEYERRRENFWKEIEIVCADVAMAIIADFMLVYLPAPTVAFRPALAVNAGGIAKFFHGCPDNAFQVALGGASYSLLQRIGAIVRNGAKLFAVGTTSSLVGTSITNAFINAKKSVDKSSAEEVENVPVLSTSVAYGVYMAVSSNLRYQILAGIIEQRLLEPMLHNNKLMLSALCFAVRTGNTFLGSLLWVDYARLIGIQGNHAEEHA